PPLSRDCETRRCSTLLGNYARQSQRKSCEIPQCRCLNAYDSPFQSFNEESYEAALQHGTRAAWMSKSLSSRRLVCPMDKLSRGKMSNGCRGKREKGLSLIGHHFEMKRHRWILPKKSCPICPK